MDRIDVHVEVSGFEFEKLTAKQWGELSDWVWLRVEAAHQRQVKPFAGMELFANADMGTSEARDYSEVDDEVRKLMRSFTAQLSLSARAFHRI